MQDRRSTPDRASLQTRPPAGAATPSYTVLKLHCWTEKQAVTYNCQFDDQRFVWTPQPTGAEIGGIYRVVLFCDDPTLNSPDHPYVVFDTHTDSEVSFTQQSLSLSARILLALNQFSRVDLKIVLEAAKTKKKPSPEWKQFIIQDFWQRQVDFLSRSDGKPYKLKDAVEQGATKSYDLPQNFKGDPDRPEFTPDHLTTTDGEKGGPGFKIPADDHVSGESPKPLVTRIFFRRWSEIIEKPSPFFVLYLSMDVPNYAENGKTDSHIRTFAAKPLEFQANEIADKWLMIQRPASTITADPLTPEELQTRPAARHILQICGVPPRGVVESWEAFRARYHPALDQVRGGRPLSFIPLLNRPNPPASKPRAVMTYQVEDHHADGTKETPPWKFSVVDGPPQDAVVLRPLSLHFWDNAENQLTLTGSLPQIRASLNGRPLDGLQLAIKTQKISDNPKIKVENKRGVVLYPAEPITITGTAMTPPQVRMGALDLLFGKNNATFGGEDLLSLRPEGAVVGVEATAHFRIQNVLPGGQDDPATEEFVPQNAADIVGSPSAASCDTTENNERCMESRFRAKRPLLIPTSVLPSQRNYLLEINEAVRAGESQALTLNVLSQISDEDIKAEACDPANNDSVVVVDSNPFFVAQVRYPPFQKASSSDSTIAIWANSDPEGAGWKLLFKRNPFCAILPPAGVGEQMIKGRDGEVDDSPSQPLPFNLGPLTSLVVDPRKAQTNFIDVPWNLRRVFGTPGEPKAGPAVRSLQYELLYGLTCNASDPPIRIAELFSRVGRIPARRAPNMSWPATKEQKVAYTKTRDVWSRIYRRYLSRLAVLEPWNDVLVSGPENNVVLDKSLSCRFRLRPASNVKLPFSLDNVANDGTLPGGATWGFESKNVLQVTVLDPSTNYKSLRSSDSAALADFYLSSLGGWGRQMAGFQNNLTKIYSDVEMGRAFRYKIERLGRIGVFWNLAKHVVVFERTVIPSRQFFGQQKKLAGWPVLRKVREYVEILEDTRRYPDDSNFDNLPEAEKVKRRWGRGFIAYISFPPGAQFNVLSSWGTDVGTIGWKVPLWNPAAQPPDVYPKPRIRLGVANGRIDKGEIIPCDVAEPQNLVFFTQTQVTINGKPADPGKDPSAWAPVEGVDYVNAPAPRPPGSSPTGSQEFSNGDTHQYAANESTLPPGYGACTFTLEKTATPINVVADRATSVLEANLASVTMVRGVPLKDTWPADLSNLASLEQQLTQGCQQLLSKIPVDGSPSQQVADQIKDALTNANPFASFNTALGNAKAEVKNLRDKVLAALKNLELATYNLLQARLNEALSKPIEDVQENLKRFEQAGQCTQEQAQQVLTEFQHGVEEKFLLLDSLPGVAGQFVARYAEVVVALYQRLQDQLGAVKNALSSNQIKVNQALGQIENLISQARTLIASINSIGRQRPASWIPDPSDFVSNQLKSYIDGFEQSATTLLSSLRGLNDTETAKAIAAIDAFTNSAYFSNLKNPQALAGFLTKYLDPVQNDYNDILKKLNSIEQRGVGIVDAWRTDASAAISQATNLSTLQAQVSVLQNWLQAQNGKLQTSIKALFDDASARVDRVANLLTTGLDQAGDFFSNLQSRFLNAAGTALGELQKRLESTRDEFANAARSYLDQAAAGILKDTQQVVQAADPAIRLLRAFGEPPQVPKLDFQRSQLGYYFGTLAPNVDLTPVISVVNQGAAVLDAIKPLGLKMPTVGALDQLLPANLKNFDLSRIFPNFAGLDLSHMFSGLKLPGDIGNDNIKITHQVDEQSKRAFVRADVNFQTRETSTLFTFGPFSLQLPSARFQANTIISATANEGVSRKASGNITGDWQLSISGTVLMNFKETALFFDDSGGLRFSIDPKKIELPGVMSFVSDAMAKFSGSSDGLSFGALPDGFQALLSLPLPDVQAGAFGITNVSLSAALAVRFAGEFTIGLNCSIARKQAPFALTIFILGGGGFLEFRSLYTPAKGQLVCEVEVGITVSASLAIALGPIKGGVYVYFGITGSYRSDGSGLTLGVLFIIRGEVSVLGIVSACITLMLQATYNSAQKTLTGRGQLSIKIKICWCFTLEVNEEVSYALGSPSGSGTAFNRRTEPVLLARNEGAIAVASDVPEILIPPPKPPDYQKYAQEYVNMLE